MNVLRSDITHALGIRRQYQKRGLLVRSDGAAHDLHGGFGEYTYICKKGKRGGVQTARNKALPGGVWAFPPRTRRRLTADGNAVDVAAQTVLCIRTKDDEAAATVHPRGRSGQVRCS